MDYKPLLDEFKAKDFNLKLIERTGNFAIYKRWMLENIVHYEVIIIARREETKIMGNSTPATEVYPASETWGAKGWTFLDLERAKIKFDSLVTGISEKTLNVIDGSLKNIKIGNRSKPMDFEKYKDL